MKNYINSFEPAWNERGVTIMCDGWSGPTNMHIINFLVYSIRGTVFHKSIDATDVYCRDTNYYYSLMEKVVQEIGEEKVVQIVTDNEASVKAAGKKLMDRFPHLNWTACAAHCLDLLLEDIGKKSSIKSVIERARKVSQFIYKYKWAVDYMKKFTGGRDLTRPGITRFATQFIMLESVVRHKTALQEMFDSSTWVTSRFGQMNDALAVEVRETLSKHPSTEVAKFWEKANEIIKIQDPIIKVLKLVDGDLKPTMGFIYEAMGRCKLAIQNNPTYYKNYWKMIDKRWNCQLHTDLHGAGCFLKPQYMYRENDIGNDHELLVGVRKVITRLERDPDNEIRATQQIYMYRDKAESFGNSSAQRAIHQMDPAMWWMTYGESAPELRKIVKLHFSKGDDLSWLDDDDSGEGGDGGGGSQTGNTVRGSSSHQTFKQSRQSAGNKQSALTPPSSDDGDDGNDGNEFISSHSTRQSSGRYQLPQSMVNPLNSEFENNYSQRFQRRTKGGVIVE
ncbi:uncharacterized protein LOC110720229 [Chenopodium quinoa]|uniref:uncharacterized protein LOC110720229 n=1 Tax=Chenopodium quinoa TaxID=63459 RepID=UPI000B787778|nr:uncharacterized protein LOC110720229 [Chenopodium quinoa]